MILFVNQESRNVSHLTVNDLRKHKVVVFCQLLESIAFCLPLSFTYLTFRISYLFEFILSIFQRCTLVQFFVDSIICIENIQVWMQLKQWIVHSFNCFIEQLSIVLCLLKFMACLDGCCACCETECVLENYLNIFIVLLSEEIECFSSF